MTRLAALWKKDPGLVISGGAHLAVLVFLLADFSRAPAIDEPEPVSVEMVTTSELNQVMQGEEHAKPLPTPQRRVDKVAALEEHNPAPPLAEARKDTPPPPSPDKPNDDPGQDSKPPEQAAVIPPPPAPPVRPADPPPVPMPPVQPPVAAAPPPPAPPTPPERPVEKAEAPPAPTPPPRPDPVKPPPPPEAEAIEPTPPPRPKIEPPKEAKEEPKQETKPPKPLPPKPEKKVAKPVPVPHPREVKEAKVVPPSPVKPVPTKPVPIVEPPPKPEPRKPDPSALDRVAQLLDNLKPDILKPNKTPVKPRSGNESKEPARDTFDPSKISALLDHDAPQHKASTGRALAQVASLGAPSGHADKMSPSMMAQLDGWMIDHYRGCWSYFGLGATQDYVPEVRVRLAQDGSLIGQPALINPPHDPNLKSLADSAIRAVNRCNPMEMPERFKPFYQSWRDRTVRFDPKEMS